MAYSYRRRTERVIAVGRIVLAGLSIATIALEPDLHTHGAKMTYGIMVGYLGYSIVVAIVIGRPGTKLGQLPLLTHILDLVWISALVLLIDNEASPFVVYLAYALVAATMRWQWQGTGWTAAAILVLLVVVGVVHSYLFPDDALALDHLAVLCVYTIVLALLLGFLGLHERQIREEVGRLAVWSQERMPGTEEESRVSSLLANATATMGAKRGLLAWDDEREPWLRLAYWDGATTEFYQASPTEYEPLVVADLATAVFVCSDVRAGPTSVTLSKTDRGETRHDGACMSPALADRFDIDTVVSVPVETDDSTGRIFFLDKRRLSTDDLTLASVVGRGASLYLAEALLREKLEESAAFEERVRLARDLHDGVLQSLTGTALQLETARRLVVSDVAEATTAIEGVQKSLLHQQRELRLLVDTLDPYRKPPESRPPLSTRLAELAESVSRQWGLEAAIVLNKEFDSRLADSQELAQDVIFIVHEGMANSGRHAAATRVTATVRPTGSGVDVSVEDDGRGFGFEGRRDGEALRSQGIGPLTLISRVERRRGTLWVTSGPHGSRIEISLPSRPAPNGAEHTGVSGDGGPRTQPGETQ